jgi:diketogulonate reductase-like aldo/keto reductase
MELRPFDSADSQVSVIGQGTWNIDRGDRDVAIAALRLGLDLGMTHIDTAEMYGDAEEIIAEAIEGRRNEVFLVCRSLQPAARDSEGRCSCSQAAALTGRRELSMEQIYGTS